MIPRTALVATLAVALLSTHDCLAQGGGGGRGGGGGGGGGGGRGRPESVTERVGAYFVPLGGDAAAAGLNEVGGGDSLSALPFVTAAAAQGHRSLVYLVDGASEPDRVQQFERTLFQDDLGIALRLFAAVRIDVSPAAAATLRTRYGAQVPLFAVFGKDGKPVGEVSMAGYKAGGGELDKLLAQAVGKDGKLTLPAFVKQYKPIVRDLEQLERDRQQLDDRDRRVDAGDKAQRAAIDKERKQLTATEKDLMEKERDLLKGMPLPPRAEGAERFPPRRGRGR